MCSCAGNNKAKPKPPAHNQNIPDQQANTQSHLAAQQRVQQAQERRMQQSMIKRSKFYPI